LASIPGLHKGLKIPALNRKCFRFFKEVKNSKIYDLKYCFILIQDSVHVYAFIEIETWGLGLYVTVDSKVQLSIPTTTNADECFPNYSKNGTKGRVRGREREGVGG
jgi:hypothetical protein